MDEIIKALEENDLAEIAEVLYGDGAYEIAKALTPAQQKAKNERLQARVGLASNVVGLAAGAAGTKSAYDALKDASKYTAKGKTVPSKPVTPKAAKWAVPLAGAALGLQVANVGGDVVANRVLARSAKSPEKVKKSQQAYNRLSEDVVASRIKLVKLGTGAALDSARVAPMAASKAKEATRKIKKNQDEMDIHWQGEISKMDDDKRQVFGWASIVEIDGKPVVDLQGDYMDLDTIEKAAYDYVLSSRKGGNQHEREGENPRHVSDLVESFIVTPEKKEQMGLPDSIPTGWWVGFKVNDDATWEQVKKGERPGFSIHGSGVRKNIEME